MMVELQRDQLASPFVTAAGDSELVGLEVECGVVDPNTGRAAHYRGDNGLLAVLRTVLDEWGGRPLHDAGNLVGVDLNDGSRLSLEHGAQLEYSSVPTADLGSAVDSVRTALEGLAELLRRFGLALLPGAFLPFDRVDTISWVPLGRGGVMRAHFAGLGRTGGLAPQILSLSTCTQAHLDYLSEEDFTEKLRMQAVVSPVVAALFVNSPLQDGRADGLLSHRSLAWERTDPRRCGVLEPALRPDVGVHDVVDWALRLPMVYHVDRDGRCRRAPDRPFASLMSEGFDDGTSPTADDWTHHLSQIWTHIRVRGTLELRAADGPAYPHIPALPALWVGLTYHPPSRGAAWDLLSGYSLAQYRAVTADLPSLGLRTTLGAERVRDLAGELVRLAREGLRARVDGGLDPPRVLGYLDPLEEILHTGETFAEQCLHRWRTDLREDPGRYVDAYRV
ncbi:glutamate-cysteine ligase family protein [Actinomadura roseirufa]|uniref:glutamate-cysteine ligase family protein n=1 Tax=Actinomadura roseirufa TaxID=2094049 RepID=UPI001F5ECCF5|nr:glutamate-cysteine ligase family protein [Actinomadura roseirufa]